MQLKLDIRDTLGRRVQVTFLHGKLLSNQPWDRYHHDDDEQSVRRKLDSL